jgi:hypothetical protein
LYYRPAARLAAYSSWAFASTRVTLAIISASLRGSTGVGWLGQTIMIT